MTEGEAIEILLTSPATIACMACRGQGIESLPPHKWREFEYKSQDVDGSTTYVSIQLDDTFCRACNGARVILNPIWKQAWEVAHPGDYAGIEQRRRAAVTKLWQGRKLLA